MQPKPQQLVLIIALIIGLSSCGFKLRGSAEPLPKDIRQLVVTGVAKGGDFYDQLVSSLSRAGATVNPPESTEKQTTLTIHNVEKLRDEVSTSGGQTLYRTTLKVTFSFGRDGASRLIDSRRLSTSREFSFDSNNPYGLEQQDKLLNNELQRDLIRQLIRQIRAAGSIKPSTGETAR